MNLEEFEVQMREAIDQALNKLHSAGLLAATLETQIQEAGEVIQALGQTLESFVIDQKAQGDVNQNQDSE